MLRPSVELSAPYCYLGIASSGLALGEYLDPIKRETIGNLGNLY